MKKDKLTISIVISTFILTVWSAVSWTILPFHSNSLKNLNDQVIDVRAMQGLIANGVYHYPGLPSGNSKESWASVEAKLKTGPRITLMVYHNEGSSLFDLKSFGLSILFNFITSVLLVLTITLTASNKTSTILTQIFVIGLISYFSKSLPFLVWFQFPIDFIIPDLIDTLISFSLVAILLSYLHKVQKA